MFLEATRTIPIVFGGVVDPVGSGIVESLSQPGGNVTGFTNYEYSIGPKWLELLKEIAPSVRSVGILRDPTNVAEIGMLGAIQTAGPQLGVEFRPVDTRTIAEIERSIATVARSGYGGLIITGRSGAAVTHRNYAKADVQVSHLTALADEKGVPLLEGERDVASRLPVGFDRQSLKRSPNAYLGNHCVAVHGLNISVTRALDMFGESPRRFRPVR